MKKITVIIPVYNEEKYLPKVFASLREQDYPQELTEIIVVDGCSTDNSANLLKNFQQEFSNLLVLANPQKIVPVSMNLAIKQATGEYLIRWDSHTLYENDYLSKCVSFLERMPEVENVGGPMRLVTTNKVQEAIKMATTSIFGIGNSSFHFEDYQGFADTVYLGAYRRQIFEKIGLFDEELVRNQDDELNYRLSKSGGKIFISPEIKSYYYPRDSLKKLWKQYYEYGYWKVRVIQKHRIPASIRHLVPGTFVLSLISGIILTPLKGLGLIILVPVLVPYLICLLYFSLKSCQKNKNKHLFLLMLVFVILHLSYGLGFLKGLLDFFGKKRMIRQ